MDFKQIQTFLQVAEVGSFTKAAEILSLSRSMVSIHIKQLETQLGVILFNRNTRQVALTDAGKSFYQDCRQIKKSYEEAVEKIQQSETMLSGTLRLGFTYEFGMAFIAPLMMPFCQQHPNLVMQYDVNSSINDLIADRLDLVIRLGNLPDSALKSRKLGQYEIGLIAAPAFLAKHPITQPRDIMNIPWITQNQWEQKSFALSKKAVKHQREGQEFLFLVPLGKYQSNAVELTRQMALAGLGLTICPLWLVQEDLKRGRLVEVLPKYHLPPQDIHLLFLDQNPLPQKIRLAIDWLKDHFKI